jgi:Mobilization protein NikA
VRYPALKARIHNSLICLDPSELIARGCKELLIMRYAEYGIGRGQFRRTIRVDCISTSELYVLDDAAIVGPCKNTPHRSISVVELKASECEWNMLIIVDGTLIMIKKEKVEVRLTIDEKAQIRQAAEERGLSMSALLRVAAMQLVGGGRVVLH